ncbi:cytochrome-c oxidase, cbb3-type subunit III [Sphingorhabdus lutea]|uniref:Cbb3-type cytochrome c oxidase subunit n=1 Tax=Sphingorhabdus lutea TaxID=1913578 RepID=A0A1L3J9V7_9SPHN|nr:cytochrome-c oxidase, cbb3-type subunit III [Sphingorhabdus lutea]APG61916.1 cytochrome-c oxidase, cbb3-type subunit III [Sphingorhabdus lutea]
MADKKYIDEATGTETVGHEWDGIQELDTPMPRWWLWSLYATIIWGVIYVILYPAWPMVNSATKGVLGWSSRGELHAEMAAVEKERAPILAALASTPLEEIAKDERLMQTAIQGGSAAFKVHCVQCHGSGADGVRMGSGYPNLNDDDWLWGGDLASLEYSIKHGIRNPDHAETRQSQMPAFGEILSGTEINNLTAYIRTISGQQKGEISNATKILFANNCASCHGKDGKGGREFGAPNLTDKIWLYGGDAAAIRTTIEKSRQGVMPRWGGRLDDVTIKMLTLYVHSLGGGEANLAKIVDEDKGKAEAGRAK